MLVTKTTLSVFAIGLSALLESSDPTPFCPGGGLCVVGTAEEIQCALEDTNVSILLIRGGTYTGTGTVSGPPANGMTHPTTIANAFLLPDRDLTIASADEGLVTIEGLFYADNIANKIVNFRDIVFVSSDTPGLAANPRNVYVRKASQSTLYFEDCVFQPGLASGNDDGSHQGAITCIGDDVMTCFVDCTIEGAPGQANSSSPMGKLAAPALNVLGSDGDPPSSSVLGISVSLFNSTLIGGAGGNDVNGAADGADALTMEQCNWAFVQESTLIGGVGNSSGAGGDGGNGITYDGGFLTGVLRTVGSVSISGGIGGGSQGGSGIDRELISVDAMDFGEQVPQQFKLLSTWTSAGVDIPYWIQGTPNDQTAVGILYQTFVNGFGPQNAFDAPTIACCFSYAGALPNLDANGFQSGTLPGISPAPWVTHLQVVTNVVGEGYLLFSSPSLLIIR